MNVGICPDAMSTAPATRLVFSRPLLAGGGELDELPHAAASINGNTPKTAVATSCLTLVLLMTLLSGLRTRNGAKAHRGHRGAASYGQAVASRVSDPLNYSAVWHAVSSMVVVMING